MASYALGMSKKIKTPQKIRSQGRKRVDPGERLVFRDAKGKFTKYRAKKKLIVQVYRGNEFTGRVLNKVVRGKPVPAPWKKTTIRMKERAKQFKMKPRRENEWVCFLVSSKPIFLQLLTKKEFHQFVRAIETEIKRGNDVGGQIDLQSELGARAARAMFVAPMSRKEIIELISNLFFESYRNSPFRASPKKVAYAPEKPHVRRIKCAMTVQIF